MAYGDKKKPCPACEKKMKNKKQRKTKSEGDSPFDDIKEGALKKQLGYGDKTIPKNMLQKIKKADVGTEMMINGKNKKITPLLQKRVNFALNFGYKKK